MHVSVGGAAREIHFLNGASDCPGCLGFGFSWRADVRMFLLLDAAAVVLWLSFYISVAVLRISCNNARRTAL